MLFTIWKVFSSYPNFQLIKTNIIPNQTFKLQAYTYTPLVPGEGFLWIIEALDVNDNVIPGSTLSNPSSYWAFPNPTSGNPLTLSGYNFPDGIDPNGITPNPGVFHHWASPNPNGDAYYLKYRITRGVWLNECNPWEQQSYIIGQVASQYSSSTGASQNNISIIKDDNAPDYSYLSPILSRKDKIEIDQSKIHNEQFSFEIYPNPNNGFFTLNPKNDAIWTMELYDSYGKLIKTKTIKGSNQLDFSDLSKGLYLVSLISDNTKLSKKLIIE